MKRTDEFRTVGAITELRRERRYDRLSINRHSTRTYLCAGRRFLLDRTTDADPRFFTLYELTTERPLPPTIEVNNQEYWGDGLPWFKAETRAFEAITAQIQS